MQLKICCTLVVLLAVCYITNAAVSQTAPSKGLFFYSLHTQKMSFRIPNYLYSFYSIYSEHSGKCWDGEREYTVGVYTPSRWPMC